MDWETIAVALLATLIATVFAIGGIAGLLSPLVHATRALNRIEHRERVEELASGGPDLVGELVRAVNSAARTSHLLITHLEEAAYVDVLTGLENRRGFFERADTVLRQGQLSALALIDLDHFKALNDRLGHAGGDRILSMLGRVLRQNVRESDLVARWGGEEFIMLFPSTGEPVARTLVERVAEALDRAVEEIAELPAVTFSAGITSFIGDVQELEGAFGRADRALYSAKARGRNLIVSAEQS